MRHVRNYVLIVCISVHNAYGSDDFLNRYSHTKEEVSSQDSFTQSYSNKPDNQNRSPSVSSLLSGINMIAFGYVCYTLYERYQLINGLPVPKQNLAGIVYTAYTKTFPSLVRLSAKAHFCIDATMTTLEVFLYKTIAQLIVLCCCCDVIDIVEMGAKRTKNMVKAVCI